MVTNAKTTTTTMVLMVPFVGHEYGGISGAMTQRTDPPRGCHPRADGVSGAVGRQRLAPPSAGRHNWRHKSGMNRAISLIKAALLCLASYCCRLARACISAICRIGWAGCRQMHRRTPARWNMTHGWLSVLRKRRGRKLSSSRSRFTAPSSRCALNMLRRRGDRDQRRTAAGAKGATAVKNSDPTARALCASS
jgi:hypothetical protein